MISSTATALHGGTERPFFISNGFRHALHFIFPTISAHRWELRILGTYGLHMRSYHKSLCILELYTNAQTLLRNKENSPWNENELI